MTEESAKRDKLLNGELSGEQISAGLRKNPETGVMEKDEAAVDVIRRKMFVIFGEQKKLEKELECLSISMLKLGYFIRDMDSYKKFILERYGNGA